MESLQSCAMAQICVASSFFFVRSCLSNQCFIMINTDSFYPSTERVKLCPVNFYCCTEFRTFQVQSTAIWHAVSRSTLWSEFHTFCCWMNDCDLENLPPFHWPTINHVLSHFIAYELKKKERKMNARYMPPGFTVYNWFPFIDNP